jgi:hypothetical protein
MKCLATSEFVAMAMVLTGLSMGQTSQKEANQPALTSREYRGNAENVRAAVIKAKKEMLGKTIENQSHQMIGEVEDLMADLQGCRIPFVIVSLEGLVGDDDTFMCFPGALWTSSRPMSAWS